MQTGAMTMKSRMTVTEALKERELLKKRITKKIGQLGREAGTDGAFAERRSARFDASKTGRKPAQSAMSGSIGHGAVSDVRIAVRTDRRNRVKNRAPQSH